MTPRAAKRGIVVLLLLLAVGGAVAWLATQAPLDLRPHAERLLRATEEDAPTLLRDTALQFNWSLEELQAEIIARRIQLGAFQGWVSAEPVQHDASGARPRKRLVATARFERAKEPVPCTFRFVHRPGGWVLGDFDVPFPPPTVGPARLELAQKAAEEIARLVLSRRFQDLQPRLGRRERRAEPLPALDARLRPAFEGLGRFEQLEITSFEPTERGHRALIRSKDEADRGVEVLLEIAFEGTRWVARRVEVRRL